MKATEVFRVLRITAGTIVGMFVLGFILRLVVPAALDRHDRSARSRAFKEVAALIVWLSESRKNSQDGTLPQTLEGIPTSVLHSLQDGPRTLSSLMIPILMADRWTPSKPRTPQLGSLSEVTSDPASPQMEQYMARPHIAACYSDNVRGKPDFVNVAPFKKKELAIVGLNWLAEQIGKRPCRTIAVLWDPSP